MSNIGGADETFFTFFGEASVSPYFLTGAEAADITSAVIAPPPMVPQILPLRPVMPSANGTPSKSGFTLQFGTEKADILNGTAGKDACYGGLGNDTLRGLDGDDVLFGEQGNDRLYGGSGNDSLHGGTGNDLFGGGTGTDTVYFRGSINIKVNLNKTGGQNTGLGIDKFVSIENLVGDEGRDSFIGNAQDNALLGNGGNDTLNGGAGNDVLVGGLGNDKLIGGPGMDSFVFNKKLGAKTNCDRIVDFTVGEDAIHLAKSIFKKIESGVLNENAFFIGAGAHDADDRIIYNDITGALYYDPDGTGSAHAIKFAVLSKFLLLTHESFLIYA
ncbi:M10 family metallopeptidase C-terminal domain-containing protein [Microvirga sp. 2MCAF38]|uniref:M10 family metallopeptidase C-terminal domain-containing protein n=1 Tax=Microvirga sp. 2MCAF38 TaxID=3232989 RepID=UPI003F9598D9